ncbi:MAG: endonuclease domain-containing protein [Anaerolineaceae bacterium]|nr:endonuclease domain-containing protein [Anaerolineaceae bacterium]
MTLKARRVLARLLRRNQTEVEGYLWQFLRDRRLGGFKFQRQHPVGRYILDFYCHEKKLAIELDGGQHGFAEQMARDQQRTIALEDAGIRIIRYWDNEVFTNTDGVLDDILEKLNGR